MLSGADTIFRVLSSLVVTADIVEPARAYDATTGGYTDTETVHAVAESLKYDYEASQIDNDKIRALDQQIFFRISEVSVGVTTAMKLRLTDGSDWDIVNVERDPSDTVYFLQIRRP